MGFLRDLFGLAAQELFEPSNDLERTMKAFMDGDAPVEEWVGALTTSQVFVLLEGDPSTASAQGKVLVLRAARGYDGAAIFTSPERATRVQQQYPAYGGGVSVELRWILRTIPQELGFVINRGWEVTLELDPNGVAELRRDVIGDA